MAPSIPFVSALLTASHASLDDVSMLQMPMLEQQLEADQDECRCPGYHQAECEAEAAQGCVWSAAGSSNEAWCQCLGDDTQPPSPICCMAMTANCLACSAQLSVAAYCANNPATNGCPQPVTLPPPVQEPRFIRVEGGTGIFWEVSGVKYWVSSCSLCDDSSSPRPCESWTSEPQSYIDGLADGSRFECTQHPLYEPPPQPLQNENENCWTPCDRTAGQCEFCGTEGVCCREGFGGDPEECGGLGGGLGRAHHSCRLPVDPVVDPPPPVDPIPVPSDCFATYEAEDATLVGAVVHTAAGHVGLNDNSGSSFVDFINANDDYIEWSATRCNEGSATLSFRYALASGNRPLNVFVNGQEVATSLSFPSTGSWEDWGEVSVQASLVAGDNVIRLGAAGQSGANVDALIITASPESPHTGPVAIPESSQRLPSDWQLSNVVRAGDTFTKQGAGSAYDAYAVLPSTTEITVNAAQLSGHVRIGLTSDSSDDHNYPGGRYVGLFPNGRMYLPPFADSRYTTDDTITMQLTEGRISLLKNGVAVATWDNTYDASSLFTKLMFYESGVGMSLGSSSDWHVSNVNREGASFRKRGAGNAYDAFAVKPGTTQMTISAAQLSGHVRLGLTGDSRDDYNYPHGRYVGLFPNGRMYLPPFADSTYTTADTITMRLADGRLSLLKNNVAVATWDDNFDDVDTLFTKLWLYESGVGMDLAPPPEFILAATDMKCPHNSGERLFRSPESGSNDISLAACHLECQNTETCAHFSWGQHGGGNVCMGCTTLQNAQVHVGFSTYDMAHSSPPVQMINNWNFESMTADGVEATLEEGKWIHFLGTGNSGLTNTDIPGWQQMGSGASASGLFNSYSNEIAAEGSHVLFLNSGNDNNYVYQDLLQPFTDTINIEAAVCGGNGGNDGGYRFGLYSEDGTLVQEQVAGVNGAPECNGSQYVLTHMSISAGDHPAMVGQTLQLRLMKNRSQQGHYHYIRFT